jgi:hypothetical protein
MIPHEVTEKINRTRRMTMESRPKDPKSSEGLEAKNIGCVSTSFRLVWG